MSAIVWHQKNNGGRQEKARACILISPYFHSWCNAPATMASVQQQPCLASTLNQRGAACGWRLSSTEPHQVVVRFFSPPPVWSGCSSVGCGVILLHSRHSPFATTGFCLCAVHKSPASGLAPFQVLTSTVPKKVARNWTSDDWNAGVCEHIGLLKKKKKVLKHSKKVEENTNQMKFKKSSVFLLKNVVPVISTAALMWSFVVDWA